MLNLSDLFGGWPARLNPQRFFYSMYCNSCQSKNIQLLKNGEYNTGKFCNDCGYGSVDFYEGTCCGNQNLISIRFEQTNKTIVQRVACKSCKTLTGGAKKKDSNFDSLPVLTQKRFLEIQEEKRASFKGLRDHLQKLSDEFRLNKNKEWWQNYSAYLKTDQWKHKRQQVLERENFLCQGCNYSKAIHVHHTTYENLGDELLFQLVALCVQCHNKLHPEKNLS